MTTNISTTQWQYLEPNNSSWRKQYRFKGQRLLPSTVYFTMQTEDMTLDEAAYNWDLSVEQISEAIAYCEANQNLLQQDADTEHQYLLDRGVELEPKTTH
ncbi:MAG: hypothetical protein AAFO95_06150 [Cyanobacteria bacterium J06600_6]